MSRIPLDARDAGIVVRYVGVDPGEKGGFACMDQDGSVSWFKPMPKDEDGVERLLRDQIGRACVNENGVTCYTIVYIEKVGGYQGVPRPGNHMFNFGDGTGFIRGYLKAMGYSETNEIQTLYLVRPQEWQKHHNVIPKKSNEDDRRWKKRLKGYAERRFPELLITDGTADALLIAAYAHDTYTVAKVMFDVEVDDNDDGLGDNNDEPPFYLLASQDRT